MGKPHQSVPSDSGLDQARHSVAHLMAAAVGQIYPDVQYGIGPTTDTGCYYDFILPQPLTPSDITTIQNKLNQLLKQPLQFVRQELTLSEAKKLFTKLHQPLKVELLEAIQTHGTTKLDPESRQAVSQNPDQVSIYHIQDQTGAILFTDLCRGPHIESVEEIKQFGIQLDKYSAAYWRGDQERNLSMQRLYCLVFPTKPGLQEFILLRVEAEKRDHRKLGKELELFFFHETAPGLAYWLPKGVLLKNLLVQYWREYHQQAGYQEIISPLINKKELWEISGHWAHYQDDMFITKAKGGETWAIKPMNCPNAMITYQFKQRSYKDLPLRFSDTDCLHRDEIPGALHGLMRAREFSQDDSHNFVMESQIKSEVQAILEIVKDFYALFGLKDALKLNLSTRPEKYMGDLETWNKAEAELKQVLEQSGFPFGIKEQDGAFYGPKIDIHLTDAIKREWQCGTIQLDFQLPRNFKLEYAAEDGSLQTPVVIHRVVYGSLERFIGILVEHFAGRLPYWFAPVQVKVLTLNQSMDAYLAEVTQVLSQVVLTSPVQHNPLRFEVDNRSESVGRKVRDAELEKVPLIMVIGPKDQAAGTVSVRTQDGESAIKLNQLKVYLEGYGQNQTVR